MIAILEAKRAGLLRLQYLPANIVSGVIVGVVALPLALAFAIASGAKPEQGLYSAIVAGFVVSTFGGTRLQIAGPTGAFVAILAGITAKHGIDGLQIATLMAGLMLILLGVARMGSIIKFIPDPVIVGFTAGIGVIIWVGEWRDFFGLPAIHGTHFHERLWQLALALPDFHATTTSLSLLSLLIVLYSSHLPGLKRVPGPLTALLVATILQAAFRFDGVATIGSTFGGIPQSLPGLHWPALSATHVIELIGPAFAIAMLGSIESLLSAVIVDRATGTRHDSNQELVGQGIANVVCPLFGGFAVTGALARTATNMRNGATSPVSGIVHSLVLVLIILLCAPLAVHVPLAVLAAILFVVAWNMSGADHVRKMVRRAPPADVVILLVTFVLTVFADLVVAVNIGVILAILHFLRRMASSVEVRRCGEDELRQELAHQGAEPPASNVAVYSVDGPFFFGAVENFERALQSAPSGPGTIIIRLRWVPFIDITGLQALEGAIIELHKRNLRVMLSGANARVRGKLSRAGILELVGPSNFHETFAGAIAASRPALPNS